MNSVFVIAHAPLAQALRQCALHVFPDGEDDVRALDVLPDAQAEESLAAARVIMDALLARSPRALVLVLVDVFGATPCNIAARLVDGVRSRLVAGVNLPMLLRAMTYRNEPLEAQVQRAIAGGIGGVMQIAVTPPQNQKSANNSGQDLDHHQQ